VKVILLPDNLFDYLNHVIRTHAGAGIDPSEGLAIYQLNQHVAQAQTVDVSNLGKARLDQVGSDGVSLTWSPEEEVPNCCAGEGCTPANPCTFCAREETNRVRCEAGGPLPVQS